MQHATWQTTACTMRQINAQLSPPSLALLRSPAERREIERALFHGNLRAGEPG